MPTDIEQTPAFEENKPSLWERVCDEIEEIQSLQRPLTQKERERLEKLFNDKHIIRCFH